MSILYIEDIKRVGGDMDFLPVLETKTISHEWAQRVGYCVWLENINPYVLANVQCSVYYMDLSVQNDKNTRKDDM
jgi:hypothetical protein